MNIGTSFLIVEANCQGAASDSRRAVLGTWALLVTKDTALLNDMILLSRHYDRSVHPGMIRAHIVVGAGHSEGYCIGGVRIHIP